MPQLTTMRKGCSHKKVGKRILSYISLCPWLISVFVPLPSLGQSSSQHQLISDIGAGLLQCGAVLRDVTETAMGSKCSSFYAAGRGQIGVCLTAPETSAMAAP